MEGKKVMSFIVWYINLHKCPVESKILDDSFASFYFLLLLIVSTPCVTFYLPPVAVAASSRHPRDP